MALATKCPHCNTIFRVAHDQLKLRGGIVRCGACNEVFDGNAALVEPVAKPSPVMPSVPVAFAPAEPPHHLDPETAPELLDAMPPGDDETPATAPDEPPLAEQDAIPEAESAPESQEEDAAPADVESVVPADAETMAAAEPAPADVLPDAAPAGDDAALAEEPASAADEQAASLDFIVDPDEFTDPLASQQAQDTAREHLVAAALDEAHHFDDLPAEDAAAEPAPAEDIPAAEIEAAAPLLSEAPEEITQQDDDANRNADEAAAADLIGAAPESASLAATGSEAASAAVTVGEDGDGAEEPGFVKRANRRQRLHRISKAVMAFGSPILLAALIAQGVTTFRNPLAAAFPALKPTLNTLCEPLGCKVNLPMQIDMLAIEQGELQTLADNTFSFATVLRNQARSAQSWPSIELTLNDANDKALVRRVFAPRDYLPGQAEVDKGFAPRSEQSIKLYFELSQVKASGYHIAIFYP